MSIRYRRWAEPTEVRRRIAPLGLVFKAGTWYVMARSRSRIRTYRVNQILSLRVTTDTFEADDSFDLGAAWTTFMASFSGRRSCLASWLSHRLRNPGIRSTTVVVDRSC